MFALYLDIQKQKDVEELPEDEIKGRWKSFFGKWYVSPHAHSTLAFLPHGEPCLHSRNRGELAEGWYDPQTLAKSQTAEAKHEAQPKQRPSPVQTTRPTRPQNNPGDDSNDSDDYGPSLPTDLIHNIETSRSRSGPSIPRLDDLQIQCELQDESLSAQRRAELESLRAARKAERQTQSTLLNELVPKAEPGTRERQLEKKRDVAAANKSFAAAKEGGGDVDLPDAEVMGGGDSLEELKRMKQANERKRSEREIRREEVLRAKMAEREERVKGMKEKEAKTMAMLQDIARARFGGGNQQSATLG